MKDIINKSQPCELFNLEVGDEFSFSPAGRIWHIDKMFASTGFAFCRTIDSFYSRYRLTCLVYPRNVKRVLYRKRYELFSSD